MTHSTPIPEKKPFVANNEGCPSYEKPSQEASNARESFQTAEKEAKVLELEGQLRELTDTCQRLQAEFENFQKRVLREKMNLKEQEKARVVLQLLPALESLENAVLHSQNEEKKGLERIQQQFWKILESEGIRPMDVIGKPFDPALHDAVLQESVKGFADGVVVAELQKGFWINTQVLRHAKVKINKLPVQDVKP